MSELFAQIIDEYMEIQIKDKNWTEKLIQGWHVLRRPKEGKKEGKKEFVKLNMI